MNIGELYNEREDLMSPEEREEYNFDPQMASIPTVSDPLREWLYGEDDATPEAATRRAFERRPPALGITDAILKEYREHWARLPPIQKRMLAKTLHGRMLRMLISCDGLDPRDLEGHLQILEAERASGTPSPVPDWYEYSTVTMGPRKIGYDGCSAHGCFRTERHDQPQFARCSRCKVAIYCGRECQRKDWTERHKQVCKSAAKKRDGIAKLGMMMQRLSDMSLTGQGSDIGSMMRDADHNPVVQERRRQLQAEANRPKNQPAPAGPDPDFF